MKLWPALALALLVLTGCSEKAPEKKGAPPTLITVTQVQPTRLELVELPDIINAALFRLRRTLAGRAVDVKLSQALPMLRLDL
ncbi:MAG TPA: hypothetical protein PKK51_00830, partial [Rhodocyclaceae bacterium]|nr:hypothetical protein [Rhodocyclaceae bacterium]